VKVVVGLDGSPSAQVAQELAGTLAWPGDTRFILVTADGGHDPRPDPSQGGAAVDEVEASAHRQDLLDGLDTIAEPLRRRGYTAEVRVEHGHAGPSLRESAAAEFADLILVGSRGRGPAASALLGSVSADLADHAPCPVLVARQPRVNHVLIATDGSDSATAIPAILDHWQLLRGLPIHVLSVASRSGHLDNGEDAHRRYAEMLAARLNAGGWHADAVVRTGDATREIVRGAVELDCDLVVTGSRGLGDMQRLMVGSVAHNVLLHSHSSVLILRGLVPAAAKKRMAFSLRNPTIA
jgi:nucleotide-binding universal stress UspA family protein